MVTQNFSEKQVPSQIELNFSNTNLGASSGYIPAYFTNIWLNDNTMTTCDNIGPKYRIYNLQDFSLIKEYTINLENEIIMDGILYWPDKQENNAVCDIKYLYLNDLDKFQSIDNIWIGGRHLLDEYRTEKGMDCYLSVLTGDGFDQWSFITLDEESPYIHLLASGMDANSISGGSWFFETLCQFLTLCI